MLYKLYKMVLFLKTMDCRASGDSGHPAVDIVEHEGRPCPVLRNLFSLYDEKFIPFILVMWLLDVEEEIICLCIKSRYLGVFFFLPWEKCT